MARYLDIGAGHNPYRPDDPEWIHTDIKELPHIDVVSDARDLNEIWMGRFDGVRASHVLEHFEWQEIDEVLLFWGKLLEPDGYLEIIVPHFDNLILDWLEIVEDEDFEGKRFEQTLQRLLGYGTDETDKHRVFLNEKYLLWLLKRAGFRHIEKIPSGDIHVRAWLKSDLKLAQIVASAKPNPRPHDISIAGKSFFFTNTAGWGDILATTCAIHELKKRGAAWVTLATRTWDDFSIIWDNRDIDYICQADRLENGGEVINDCYGLKLYGQADYHIYASHYRDNHIESFYEARLRQVGLNPSECECKGHIDLGWHIEPDLKNHWLPQAGIEPGEYVVLHHQASHISRSWYIDHVNAFCRLCVDNGIPVVVVGQSSPIDMEGVLNWTHQKSFDSGAGLVKLARAVVCTDSVFSHIAHAYDKPFVCLYSDAPAELRLAPHATRMIALKGEPGQAAGIEDISAQVVFGALAELKELRAEFF